MVQFRNATLSGTTIALRAVPRSHAEPRRTPLLDRNAFCETFHRCPTRQDCPTKIKGRLADGYPSRMDFCSREQRFRLP